MKTLWVQSSDSIRKVREVIQEANRSIRVRGWYRMVDRRAVEGCLQSTSRGANTLQKVARDLGAKISWRTDLQTDPFLFKGITQLPDRDGGGAANHSSPGAVIVKISDVGSRGLIEFTAYQVGQAAALKVDILIDGEKISEEHAVKFSERALRAGHPTGFCGGSVRIPDALLDGYEHVIGIRTAYSDIVHEHRALFPFHSTLPMPWKKVPRTDFERGREMICSGDYDGGLAALRTAIDDQPELVFRDMGFLELRNEQGRYFESFRERLVERTELWHSSTTCTARDCCKRQGLGLRNIHQKALRHFGTADASVVRKSCEHWPRYFASKIFIKQYAEKFDVKVPRTIGALRSVDDLDKFELPTRYVIKPEATSGIGLYLMHDGINLFNGRATRLEDIKEDLRKCESEDQLILIEEFLVQEGVASSAPFVPLDFKMHAFGGRVRIIHVDDKNHLSRDRLRRVQGWFDRNLNPAPFRMRVQEVDGPMVARPDSFSKMLAVADEIARDFGDYVRVDLYAASDGVFLGEITTTTHNGVGFTPYGDYVMSQLWDLYPGPVMADQVWR